MLQRPLFASGFFLYNAAAAPSVIRHSGAGRQAGKRGAAAVAPARGCADSPDKTSGNLAHPKHEEQQKGFLKFRGDLPSRPQLIHDGRLLSKIDGPTSRRVAGKQRIFFVRYICSFVAKRNLSDRRCMTGSVTFLGNLV